MKDESGKMKACASERKPSFKPAFGRTRRTAPTVSVLCTLFSVLFWAPTRDAPTVSVLFYCKLFSRFCGELLVYNSKKEYFCNPFD